MPFDIATLKDMGLAVVGSLILFDAFKKNQKNQTDQNTILIQNLIESNNKKDLIIQELVKTLQDK